MHTADFLRAIRLNREKVPNFDHYPFSIPAIANLDRLEFAPGLNIIIGENGAGKSTLVEAIAVKFGFNAEGGSRKYRFSTKETHSALKDFLVLEKSHHRPTDGFFLRAESFYALSTEADKLEEIDRGHLHWYGGKSLHEQSHGEAFFALFKNRLGGNCIMATHSPIFMGFPGARIYEIGASGIQQVEYEDTDHFRITRTFLNNREGMLRHLLSDEEGSSS